MTSAMALSALIMGLSGGPHCIAMCGAACAGIAQMGVPGGAPAHAPAGAAIGAPIQMAPGTAATAAAGAAAHWGRQRALALFQLGRLLGYSAIGALAALTMQGLGWLTVHSAVLRPVWTMVHLAAIVLGLMLLFLGRQPVWLEDGARRIWAKVRSRVQGLGVGAPLALGLVWALLPCGLLYSAVMVAALASNAAGGAGVMALFALGSGLSLWLGPWLLLRLGFNGRGGWGMRVAGLALAAVSVWGLWMGLVHEQAPWC